MAQEKTVRDEAVEALQKGGSVVVNGVIYTLMGNPETNTKSLKDLPGDEVFAVNADDRAKAAEALKKQLADLQARYAALESSKAAEAKAPAPKADAKKEDQ